MKSKLSIASYSAWCPISDLSAWHRETKNRGLPYYENIEDCIGQSKGSIFDTLLAQLRSPMYWDVPMDKQNTTKLYIYVGSRDGIFDGKKGTVPISHSLNFYNKLVSVYDTINSTFLVSDTEKVSLYENQETLGDFGMIGKRAILLRKEYKNIHLTVFDGTHEILLDNVLDDIKL